MLLRAAFGVDASDARFVQVFRHGLGHHGNIWVAGHWGPVFGSLDVCHIPVERFEFGRKLFYVDKSVKESVVFNGQGAR